MMIEQELNILEVSDKLSSLVKKLAHCFTSTQASICAKYDLTVAEATMISSMDPVRKTCTMGIEERQELSKGRISRIVESLKQKGCLIKIEHHEDRRHNIIELTDRGRQIRREIINEQAAQCRRVLAHVPEDQRSTIIPALEHLVKAIEISRHESEALEKK